MECGCVKTTERFCGRCGRILVTHDLDSLLAMLRDKLAMMQRAQESEAGHLAQIEAHTRASSKDPAREFNHRTWESHKFAMRQAEVEVQKLQAWVSCVEELSPQ